MAAIVGKITPMHPRFSLLLAVALGVLAAPADSRAEASEDTKSGIAAARVDYERGRKAIDRMAWKEAIAALESAARHDPADAEFQNLLGFAHRNAGNMEAAFRHYDRALALNPWHRGAHEYIGRAYLMADKPDKAIEHLKALERVCGGSGCRERDLLRRAIDEYPWPADARMSRSY
jgi:tetratricopeptide (TPR) repeat protein